MRTDESKGPKQKPVSAAPRRTRRSVGAAARTKRTTPALSVEMPGEEKIRLRAYQFYVERGGVPGDPFADWIRAERDLIAEAAKTRVNS